MTLRIGTRGSALALAQARLVASVLLEPAELVAVTTAGDVDRARGDKSRWVGALEAMLLAGDIDLAVHSAKDVPAELAAGTALVAAPRRADPMDVLVGEGTLTQVREAARVGTSALRRRAQLLAVRPDLELRELRGNVDTRLKKLAAGEVDVLVLAAAGLDRLHRRHEAGGTLQGAVFVPAAGQGIIAVQAREGSAAADVARAACHARTMACLLAERAAVRELVATCHTPVGVHADSVRIRGFAGLPDGSRWVVDEVAIGPAGKDGRATSGEIPRGAGEARPGVTGDARPEAGEGRPGAGEGRPGAGEGRPGADEARPAAGEARPAAGEARPEAGEGRQVADDALDPDVFQAAGRQLAQRMLAAGAADLLRDAEAMAAR